MNRRLVKRLAVGSLPILLSGCVAAAIPVVAGGMIARTNLRHKGAPHPAQNDAQAQTSAIAKSAVVPAPTLPSPPLVVDAGDGKPALAIVTGLKALPVPDREAERTVARVSVEATAFTQFAVDDAEKRRGAGPRPSIVLVRNVDVAKPAFIACRPQEPLAVLIDIDGGVADFTPAALAQLRAAGLQIIWLSGRDAGDAQQLQNQLVTAGLMVTARDSVSLNRGANDRKQLQRLDTAKAYCVVAIAGHKRSDFDELFDYVRQDESTAPLKSLWNHGWFLLPLKTQ